MTLPDPLAEHRRAVRDALGRAGVRWIKIGGTGRMTGRAYQAVAISVGLDQALLRYRLVQSVQRESGVPSASRSGLRMGSSVSQINT